MTKFTYMFLAFICAIAHAESDAEIMQELQSVRLQGNNAWASLQQYNNQIGEIAPQIDRCDADYDSTRIELTGLLPNSREFQSAQRRLGKIAERRGEMIAQINKLKQGAFAAQSTVDSCLNRKSQLERQLSQNQIPLPAEPAPTQPPTVIVQRVVEPPSPVQPPPIKPIPPANFKAKIESIFDKGRFIKLGDGLLLEIEQADRPKVEKWAKTDKILVGKDGDSYRLINELKDESASARALNVAK